MATPIKNNLPPQSQQWVRDMEKRLADLERENQTLRIITNQNATQISAAQEGIRFARSGTQSKTTKITTSGSQSGNFEVTLAKPAWATRATVIATLTIAQIGVALDNEQYLYDAVLESRGASTTELHSFPYLYSSQESGVIELGKSASASTTVDLLESDTSLAVFTRYESVGATSTVDYLATITAFWNTNTETI